MTIATHKESIPADLVRLHGSAGSESGRLTRRSGARSKKDVEANVLLCLESGTSQSATHIEQMVMNMATLFGRTFPEIVIDHDAINKVPFISRIRLFGEMIRNEAETTSPFDPLDRMWVSDTVRGWCAMATAQSYQSLTDGLPAMRRYATDPHFAVREWAWLAIRPMIIKEPLQAIELLGSWIRDSNPLVRRFAVEVTRPRSVWGGHVQLFKERPEFAEAFLQDAICDPSRYVQDSVSNWINDVVRTRPDWVELTTSCWGDTCKCAATTRIITRSRRGLMGV